MPGKVIIPILTVDLLIVSQSSVFLCLTSLLFRL